MKRLLLASVVCMALLPLSAFAQRRGGVFVGPVFAPYWWYGGYGAFGPFGMYPYGPFGTAPNAGLVKLDTKIKDAEVFINGNYAGTAGQLKNMTMSSGNYNIEVRAPGRTPFDASIHVVAGKTMTLRPDLNIPAPLAPSGS